ncbi:hypothetical protein QMK33_19680 [Hymenobacter sp. H14-R3]|uniref:hypothetical protein n=1 Tax=Hymenobacter sp. H14-R3 TaxID=3046308 RepID=UPI0024BA060F|nr:hypothetical protein [Hymenobacter sp. H14-R3]MDJ0367375.1 hypothetical protein [Hymenobacter sp. H14-R3]
MRLSDFFKSTFCDATGTPDGKLLTIAGVAAIVVAAFPIGWVWGRWPPEYIWSPTLLFLAAGLGIDAFVTKAKILADRPPAPAAEVTVETAQNVNLDGQS